MNSKLVVIIIILFIVFTGVLFAQQAEEITLTTYFPPPYGSYATLEVNNLKVNNTPGATGVVNFTAGTEPAPGSPGDAEGSIYYDSGTHVFRFKDNTGWKTFGGGAGKEGRLINVQTNYWRSDSLGASSFLIPNNVHFAVLYIKGNCSWNGSHDKDENSETMEVFIDLAANTSSGIHSFQVGPNVTQTMQYTWANQPLGSNIATMAGDTTGPGEGAVVGPNFTVNGGRLYISHLSGDATYRWQQSFLVRFYRT